MHRQNAKLTQLALSLTLGGSSVIETGIEILDRILERGCLISMGTRISACYLGLLPVHTPPMHRAPRNHGDFCRSVS